MVELFLVFPGPRNRVPWKGSKNRARGGGRAVDFLDLGPGSGSRVEPLWFPRCFAFVFFAD